MPSSVILGTARTPLGKMGGALKDLDATDLGGTAIAAALERAQVDPAQVEQVAQQRHGPHRRVHPDVEEHAKQHGQGRAQAQGYQQCVARDRRAGHVPYARYQPRE